MAGGGEVSSSRKWQLDRPDEHEERGVRRSGSQRLQGASKRARGRVEDGESGNCIRRPWTGKKNRSVVLGSSGLEWFGVGVLGA